MIAAVKEFVKGRPDPERLVFLCFGGVFLTMPMGTSPPIIFGALGTFIWLFSGMAFRLRTFFRQRWFWPVMVFILLPWAGLLYTPDPWGFGINYARKTYYWVFCLVLASLSFKHVQPRWLIDAFLLGVALNACVGILQLAGVIAPKQECFTGLTSGYYTLSAYLVVALLLCAFYFRKAQERKNRVAVLLLMGLYFFHLIILEGRTGYVTFIVLCPLFVKTLFKRVNIWKMTLVCLLIVGLMPFTPIVKKRLDQTIKELKYHFTTEPHKAWGREYTENQDRFYMWKGAIQIFLENPIIGLGTGAYPKSLKDARDPKDPVIAHPHNNFLYMASSYGMVGIVAFMWLFLEMLRNGWKGRDTSSGFFVMCASLVLFISGLFNTTIVDSGGLLFFSLAAGMQGSLPMYANYRPPNVKCVTERVSCKKAKVINF